MTASYDVGDTVTLRADFGTPDPTGDVILTVTLPDASTVVFRSDLSELAHVAGSGVYTRGYTTILPGKYTYRFETDAGDPIAAEEGAFIARAVGSGGPASTYSGDPSLSDLDRVRFELQDVGPSSFEFTDGEIAAKVEEHRNPDTAAARPLTAATDLAWILAARAARKSDSTVGDVSKSESGLAKAFSALATKLQARARASEGAGKYMSIPAGNLWDQSTIGNTTPFRVGEMDDRVT